MQGGNEHEMGGARFRDRARAALREGVPAGGRTPSRLGRLSGRRGRSNWHPCVVRVSRLFTRRLGPIGLALTAYDVWRLLPKRHRRLLLQRSRGLAFALAAAAWNRRNRPPNRPAP